MRGGDFRYHVITENDLGERILFLHVVEGRSMPQIARMLNQELTDKGITKRVTAYLCATYINKNMAKATKTEHDSLEYLLSRPVDLVVTLEENVNRIKAALNHTMENDGRLKPADRRLFMSLIDAQNQTTKLIAEIEGRIQTMNVVNVTLVQQNIKMAVQVIQEAPELSGQAKQRLIKEIASRMVLEEPTGKNKKV